MDAEYKNLTERKLCLGQGVFTVRWPLKVPELEKIDQPGVQIEVKELMLAVSVQTPAGKIEVGPVVKTSRGGFIPLSYLERRPDYECLSKLEKDVSQKFGYDDWRIGTGRWWAGRVTPPDAAGRLMSQSWSQGSFAVCQPPEWEPQPAAWAPFCLLVRTHTGDVDQIWHEWRETEYYNLRFAGPLEHPRPQMYDIMPSPPPTPPAGLLYFVILRTDDGLFYIEKSGKKCYSLEELLNYYYQNPLPTFGVSFKNVSLRMPADVNLTPFSSPRPLLYPMPFKEYRREPFKLVKAQKPGQALSSFPMWLWKDKLEKKVAFEETKSGKETGPKPTFDISRRGYMHINGTYHPVVLRSLQRNFNLQAFEKDMTRIHHADNSVYPKAHTEIFKNAEKLKPTYFRSGSNFISHIVCYGDGTEKDNWMAYEGLAGVGLDRLLTIRRYDDWWMSPRTKLEIAYQVAAGMRFLEQNLLCHRHLRAANVCVYQEHLNALVVKITDYMVPYARLDPEFVEEVDLTELEWPWMAPDCFRSRAFDIISDVWSYGCFLFEVLHDGLTPYSLEDDKPANAQDLFKMFMQGQKMTVGEHNQVDSYWGDLIGACMRYEAAERPTFDYLYNYLRQLLFDASASPEKTNEKYLGGIPKTFSHKWTRGKLKDYVAKKQ